MLALPAAALHALACLARDLVEIVCIGAFVAFIGVAAIALGA